MQQQEIAPPRRVNINPQCEPNPRIQPIKKREAIFWVNNSEGDVFLDFPEPEIFYPPPPQNPLRITDGETSPPLFISDSASTGTHEYKVGGSHCLRFAPRIGTIDVEN